MERLVRKFAGKLIAQGLCEEGAPLMAGLDADIVWNREDETCALLKEVIGGLNINSILFAEPAEPYFSILNDLAEKAGGAITPDDCETRTFLHDIPISSRFEASSLIDALKKRKSVFIPHRGLVTFGTVSPEQAFVTYSSVCFAGFVKFFSDHLRTLRKASIAKHQRILFNKILDRYQRFLSRLPDGEQLEKGPFTDSETVIRALAEAGQQTVRCRMVDSYFGNISYLLNDKIYISQTASSLDELAGCIDACPLDGSSCVGITASSEFSAHREILTGTGNRAILHGHPKFSVVMSMACEKEPCTCEHQCHLNCPETRFVQDIPIVPGEVGTGPHGLSRTLPPAMEGHRGVLVYGHGLFTVGRVDFRDAFTNLVDVEKMCLEEYLKIAG